MKKILFATASIVAFSAAGAAMADVEVTGEARMGLLYESVDIGSDDESDVDGTSRIRVKFAMTGTSDSGLTFGANIRADNAGGGNGQGAEHALAFIDDDCENGVDDLACAGAVSTAGDVFVSGSFGTLTYGDTDSAVKQRTSNVDIISLTGLSFVSLQGDDAQEIIRGVQPGPRIRYDYDFDSFGFSLSTTGELEEFAVGASYSGDFGGTTIDFGIGYEDTFDFETIVVSAGAGFGAFSAKVAYADLDGDLTDVAVSGSYDAGDLDVTAFYRTLSDDDDSIDTFGIGASYDLGGGLVAKTGIAMTDIDGDSVTAADLGLAMTF